MDHLLSGVIYGLGFKPRKITPKFFSCFLLKNTIPTTSWLSNKKALLFRRVFWWINFIS